MRRIFKHIAFICCFNSFAAIGQFSYLGAEAYGRAYSLVAVPSYASIYQNPAGLALFKENFINVHYFKTLPVEGLHTLGLQAAFQGSGWGLGFSADSFGDVHFKESRVGGALAVQRDKVAVGIKGSYWGMQVGEVSNRNTFLGEIGMIVQPLQQLNLGLLVSNFTGAKLYGLSRFPTVLSAGLGIQPHSKLNISVQWDYDFQERNEIRMGLAYALRKEFLLFTGVSPQVKALHFGTQFRYQKFGFAFSAATHPYVGLAPQFTLIYHWK